MMATQLGIKKQDVSKPEHQAAEIEILNPDEVIKIEGVEYCVREYGHIEFIRLLHIAEPLVAMLTQRIQEQPKLPLYEHFLLVFSEHYGQLLPMILQAVSMEQATFENLPVDAQELVLAVWLKVNEHFFSRRAQMRGELLKLMSERDKSILAKSTVS